MRAMRARGITSLFAAALMLGLSASAASALTTTLRWTHPDPSNVDGFTVHIGYSSGNYSSALTRDFSGLQPDQAGVYQVTIDVESDRLLYVAVRAYDGPETSVYSNEKTRYETTALGTPGRPRLSNY